MVDYCNNKMLSSVFMCLICLRVKSHCLYKCFILYICVHYYSCTVLIVKKQVWPLVSAQTREQSELNWPTSCISFCNMASLWVKNSFLLCSRLSTWAVLWTTLLFKCLLYFTRTCTNSFCFGSITNCRVAKCSASVSKACNVCWNLNKHGVDVINSDCVWGWVWVCRCSGMNACIHECVSLHVYVCVCVHVGVCVLCAHSLSTPWKNEKDLGPL